MTTRMRRREFLKRAAMAAGAAVPFAGRTAQGLSAGGGGAKNAGAAMANPPAPKFSTRDPAWQVTWDAALAVLAANVRTMPSYPHPVLVEGSVYVGVWQECGPHEGLVYGGLSKYVAENSKGATPLQIARNNHMAFFALQTDEGQMAAAFKETGPPATTGGFGQIQMVVPIAATAWELVQQTGDDELLAAAYKGSSAWDAWLRRYRDTRKTGLVEGFCTYDTGHDNSPRWKGIPGKCPDNDARKCPNLPGLPRLCPDLSATVYGARVALAAMAKALGKGDDAARWQADAEHIRGLILTKLYSPEDGAFYDLDSDNKFVRVRSDAISRVLGEHVVDPVKDKAIFEAVWTKQIHNPKAFWAPYPLASIALDDPAFVRPIPRNSWGGASQALTALRAPRWMPFYGKQAEMKHMMEQWCSAIMRHGEFRQQMDPLTGEFTQPDPGGYSPAALVFLDFARQLSNGRYALGRT
jgi:hypothetical protein